MGKLKYSHYLKMRPKAEEFPWMIIISVIYPCNLGCPFCPYTDGNSELRKFYHEHKGDILPLELWKKIADESGPHGAFLRCTGGGEPMLHKNMVEMVEYAKEKGCRIWLNTNGTVLGPNSANREKLRRLIAAQTDLIEFSADAGDAATYNIVRPPRRAAPDPKQWHDLVDNIRAALRLRSELKSPTRIVVSMIMQKILEGKMEAALNFWTKDVGVDYVIQRKYLTWDDNTVLRTDPSLHPDLYNQEIKLVNAEKEAAADPNKPIDAFAAMSFPNDDLPPCVWPFERLNVDTLGRVALCGQDISFRTSHLFPNINRASIKEVWQSPMFKWYRETHLRGEGSRALPCRNCSAWKAGIRDWKHNWQKVMKGSGANLKIAMGGDLGAEVDIYEPPEESGV